MLTRQSQMLCRHVDLQISPLEMSIHICGYGYMYKYTHTHTESIFFSDTCLDRKHLAFLSATSGISHMKCNL